MTRPFSITALAFLASLLLAPPSSAGTVGNFCSITDGNLLSGGNDQVSLRPVPSTGTGSSTSPRLERWIAFSTRQGSSTIREIWQGWNLCSAYSSLPPLDARRMLLGDPNGVISYRDPAWSPNGRYLAYVQTDALVSQASIYVQEYLVSTVSLTAATTVGSPILVVSGSAGVRNLHPAWHPAGNQLAFDSNMSGTSTDIYTVDVFPTPGVPVQLTTVPNKEEVTPAWRPDGAAVAYATDVSGSFTIETIPYPSGTPSGIETAPAPVDHLNPSWSSDGLSIYYDAPTHEIAGNPSNIWKFNLATQTKGYVNIDMAEDYDVSVSRYTNVTAAGDAFNYISFTSLASALGINIWRGPCIVNLLPGTTLGQPGPNYTISAGGNLKVHVIPVSASFLVSDVDLTLGCIRLLYPAGGTWVAATSAIVSGGKVKLEFAPADINTLLSPTSTYQSFDLVVDAPLIGSCARIQAPFSIKVKL